MLARAGKKKHLYIVCTDSFAYQNSEDCVVIVNVSSCKDGLKYDRACILAKGSHSFIDRNSYVRYRNARIEKVSTIQKEINSREIEILSNGVSPKILQRVIKGFGLSDFTPIEVLEDV